MSNHNRSDSTTTTPTTACCTTLTSIQNAFQHQQQRDNAMDDVITTTNPNTYKYVILTAHWNNPHPQHHRPNTNRIQQIITQIHLTKRMSCHPVVAVIPIHIEQQQQQKCQSLQSNNAIINDNNLNQEELELFLIHHLKCPANLPAIGIWKDKYIDKVVDDDDDDDVHWITELDVPVYRCVLQRMLFGSDYDGDYDDDALCQLLLVLEKSVERFVLSSSSSDDDGSSYNISKGKDDDDDDDKIAVTRSGESVNLVETTKVVEQKRSHQHVLENNDIITTTMKQQHHQHQRRKMADDSNSDAIRLFVAGDKSQVGKSTVCLGLLGSFLRLGYPASRLAYIKPATQCEVPQLVTTFCEAHGIACVPVGPIVYFKGFTRAYLDGNTETSEKLLSNTALAIDELAKGKDIVIVDGVGYPSVGSICGTSNADVALSCGPISVTGRRKPMPVLLVGKSGVGDAVDSFNLNAAFFEIRKIPVIGCIFNRLSLEGFYSYRSCKESIDKYFSKFRPNQMPFGYVPDMSKDLNEGMTPFERSEILTNAFFQHVDVKALIGVSKSSVFDWYNISQPVHLQKINSISFMNNKLSREHIEAAAKAEGASGG